MNYYNKFGGKYVSYDFSDNEITTQISMGGFEPNERSDIQSMSIGGYLPESSDSNPCFNYAINGDDTGFEWYWNDMPKSFHAKLWREAMSEQSRAASILGEMTSDAKKKSSVANSNKPPKLGKQKRGRPAKTQPTQVAADGDNVAQK